MIGKTALWSIDPGGGNLAEHPSVSGGFDWYLDHRRVVHTREGAAGSGVWEIVASNLETGREAVLYRGPHAELAVAPGGGALLFSGTVSHAALNLHVLPLSPPGQDGLPASLGEAERITDGEGAWQVHTGSWSPDGKKIVYTRDVDMADLQLIENYE